MARHNKLSRIVALPLLAFLTASCTENLYHDSETKIDNETAYFGDHLVVNGMLLPQGIELDVAKTVAISSDFANGNAAIGAGAFCLTILEDGNEMLSKEFEGSLDEAFHVSLGTADRLRLDFGKRYSVNISSEKYGEARTPAVAPFAIGIDSAWMDVEVDELYASCVNPSPKLLYGLTHDEHSDGKWDSQGVNLDKIVNNAGGYFPTGRKTLSENCWIGMTFATTVDSVRMNLVVFSEEYSAYLTSRDDYFDNRGNGLSDYAHEVKTNIEGGYGFFGAVSLTSFTFATKPFIEPYLQD